MKFLLATVFLSLIHFSFGQVEFYINDLLVDQSVVQNIPSQGLSNVEMSLKIKNITSDTATIRLKQCVLQDSPNWELSYVIWSDDPGLFGIDMPGSLVTQPCWEIPSNVVFLHNLSTGESVVFVSSYNVLGTGCEDVRYYAIDNETSSIIDSIDVNYCTTLGVNEIDESVVNVYPNPSNSLLNIESDASIQRIQFVDINGREVFAQEFIGASSVAINCETIHNGLYFVRVIFENQPTVLKRVSVVH